MKKTIYGMFFLAFILSACTSKQDMEGEAFLDKSGGPTKLALVNIQIVTEEQFVEHIKKQYPIAKEASAKLSLQIEDFNKRLVKTQALLAQAAVLRGAVSGMSYPMGMGGLVADNIRASNSVVDTLNESGRQLIKKASELASGASEIYLGGKFDGAILSTTTNSEGKFKLSLASGKKVALIANKDGMTWALWITPDKTKPTIMLSNKNLAGSKCNECVFTDAISPKTLAGF